MVLNFSQINVTSLNGEQLDAVEICKIIANIIYCNADNLDLVEYAMAVKNGGEIDVTPKEASEIKSILICQKSALFAYIKKAIRDYIDCALSKV